MPHKEQITEFSVSLWQCGQRISGRWVSVAGLRLQPVGVTCPIGSTWHKAPARRKSSQQRHAAFRSIPERITNLREKRLSSTCGGKSATRARSQRTWCCVLPGVSRPVNTTLKSLSLIAFSRGCAPWSYGGKRGTRQKGRGQRYT